MQTSSDSQMELFPIAINNLNFLKCLDYKCCITKNALFSKIRMHNVPLT